MNYDASLWLIFILIGLATTLPRASFIVLGNRVVLPSVLQRALRYAPAARWRSSIPSWRERLLQWRRRPCHEIRGCHLLAAWLHCSAFAI